MKHVIRSVKFADGACCLGDVAENIDWNVGVVLKHLEE